MKVLLVRDIEKLGALGDVIEVKTGYARNYLLPRQLAVLPTAANLRSISKEKAKHTEWKIHERKRLEAAAAAVEGAEAVIAAKANEQGHLFGSVSGREIADNLRKQGFDVADEMAQLSEHIKQLGTFQVMLKFAEGLTATVNVVVVAEQNNENQSTNQVS